MKTTAWRRRLLESTRGRILDLLRGKEQTVNQLAAVDAALRILKELGGVASFQESQRKHWIRGNGCPLAAATGRHPQACLIAESLLAEIIGVPVKQRCTYSPAPSCRFEVQ